MAGYQHIWPDKYPVQYITRLTITRPQRRNALNDLTMDELRDGIEDVDSKRFYSGTAAAAETITLRPPDHGEGTQPIRESRNPVYEGRK